MEKTRKSFATINNDLKTKEKGYTGYIIEFVKFFVYVLCFFVFSMCNIFGFVRPSIFGVFVSLSLIEENFFIIVLSYVIATLLTGANSFELIFYALTIFVCFLARLFFKVKKKVAPPYASIFLCVIIGFCYCFFNFGEIYESVVNLVFNVISCLCFGVFYKVFKNKRLNFKLQTDESICFGVVLCLFFCGLNGFNFFVFDFIKFVGIFTVLIFSLILPFTETLLVGFLSGLGVGLGGGNLTYLLLFCLVAIITQIFKGQNKIFVCVSTIMVDLFISLFFDLETYEFLYLNLITTIVCASLFLLLGKSLAQKLKSFFVLESSEHTIKDVFDNDKIFLSQKLLTTAEVFYEMDKNFRKLLTGKLDEKNSKIMICNEVLRENCENCENKTRCIKNFDREIKKVFENLTNIGFEKGRITLLDLPAYITNRCVKVNSVVNSYNSLLEKYKKYSRQNSNVDNSKMMVAQQLRGISKMLRTMAESMKKEIVEDKVKEEKIREVLTYNNIVPLEIVCFEKDIKTNVVEIILRIKDFDAEKIKDALKGVYKSKMFVDKFQTLDNGKNVCVRFETSPIFDLGVGFAQSMKGGENVCGDTFTATKLNRNKFLIGVCDGMGHGEKANKSSEVAISIIEDFYRADFDNETILTSVNTLLGLQQDETFSALDLGVVDLKTGEIDFIKQGATSSFILSKEKVFRIESSGLPLGILSEIKPRVVKTVLTPEDFVVIVSDGVIDSFGNEEEFEKYLITIKNKNPQEMAEKILRNANKLSKGYPDDDMTVLIGKLFYF